MAGRDEGMSAQERLFWEAVQRALLMGVRTIEDRLGMEREGGHATEAGAGGEGFVENY